MHRLDCETQRALEPIYSETQGLRDSNSPRLRESDRSRPHKLRDYAFMRLLDICGIRNDTVNLKGSESPIL